MTDDDRKLLTEYLGECWHEQVENTAYYTCVCGFQAVYKKDFNFHVKGHNTHHTRTFATPADLFLVFGKMVEKGEWDEFRTYADGKRIEEAWKRTGIADLDVWLFCLNTPDKIKDRLTMAATFIKEMGE